MSEEEDLTLLTCRQVSLHACCFGFVSLFKCKMLANCDGTLLLILQLGFPRTMSYIFIYVHCYICYCNSVDFERSNACINTTIT